MKLPARGVVTDLICVLCVIGLLLTIIKSRFTISLESISNSNQPIKKEQISAALKNDAFKSDQSAISPTSFRHLKSDAGDLQWLKAIFKKQEKDRQKIFEIDEKSILELKILAITPQMVCPGLARVGRIHDGGKWMCRPWLLPKDCVVYSMGIGQDNSFEKELLEIQPTCQIYSFDSSNANAPLFAQEKRMHFQPKRINVGTYDQIRAEFGHNTKIDVLKMDIEGNEFAVFTDILGTGKLKVPVCHILVEAHVDSTKAWMIMLHQLETAGFYLFSIQIAFCGKPCAEISWIHKDCAEDFGLKPENLLYNIKA